MRLYLEPTSHAAVLTIHTCFTLRPYIHKQATSGRPIIIQQIKWRGPMNYLLSQSSLASLNTIFVFLTVKCIPCLLSHLIGTLVVCFMFQETTTWSVI
jgi:hypothetical protein